MAKRLSKALRGKRRWIGIVIREDIDDLNKLENAVKLIGKEVDTNKLPRIFDYRPRKLSNGQATAILQIRLEDSQKLRSLLENETSIIKWGLMSVTSSGKIRLVRERLNMLN